MYFPQKIAIELNKMDNLDLKSYNNILFLKKFINTMSSIITNFPLSNETYINLLLSVNKLLEEGLESFSTIIESNVDYSFSLKFPPIIETWHKANKILKENNVQHFYLEKELRAFSLLQMHQLNDISFKFSKLYNSYRSYLHSIIYLFPDFSILPKEIENVYKDNKNYKQWKRIELKYRSLHYDIHQFWLQMFYDVEIGVKLCMPDTFYRKDFSVAFNNNYRERFVTNNRLLRAMRSEEKIKREAQFLCRDVFKKPTKNDWREMWNRERKLWCLAIEGKILNNKTDIDVATTDNYFRIKLDTEKEILPLLLKTSEDKLINIAEIDDIDSFILKVVNESNLYDIVFRRNYILSQIFPSLMNEHNNLLNGTKISHDDTKTEMENDLKKLLTSHDVPCTSKMINALKRAEDKGYLSIEQDHVIWKGAISKGKLGQLAYLCGKIYDYQWNEKGLFFDGTMPCKAIESLFRVQRLHDSLRQVYLAKKTQTWRETIDELLNEA